MNLIQGTEQIEIRGTDAGYYPVVSASVQTPNGQRRLFLAYACLMREKQEAIPWERLDKSILPRLVANRFANASEMVSEVCIASKDLEEAGAS